MKQFKSQYVVETEAAGNKGALCGTFVAAKQKIALLQVRTIAPEMDKAMKISFVFSFLEGTAANRCYTVVAGNRMSATWEEFEYAIRNEFIPSDSVQRSRDKLRRLAQRTSVSDCLSKFNEYRSHDPMSKCRRTA